jgi:hypothetical protein
LTEKRPNLTWSTCRVLKILRKLFDGKSELLQTGIALVLDKKKPRSSLNELGVNVLMDGGGDCCNAVNKG